MKKRTVNAELLAELSGQPVLVCTDQKGLDKFSKEKEFSDFSVDIKHARNPDHHRLFMAIVRLVWENRSEAFEAVNSEDAMLQTIKIGVGYVDVVYHPINGWLPSPKSISFHNMGQIAFEEFYDKALEFIATKITPGIDLEALQSEARLVMYN